MSFGKNNPTGEISSGLERIPKVESAAIEGRQGKARYNPAEPIVLPMLTDFERKWLSEHPAITVGSLADWAPIDFVNSSGIQRGITADYIQLIQSRLDITLQTSSKLPWSEMLEQARNAKIDIVADVVKTKERAQFLYFSVPYFRCPYATVTRRTNRDILDLQDFSNQIVVVEKDYYLHSRLQEEYPKIELKVVDSTKQALEAVSREKADVYIGNRAVISWLIEEHQLQNLIIAGNTDFSPTLLRFGVRRDWPELISILNKTLDTITGEEHRAIRKKWLGVSGREERELFNNIVITSTEQAWLDKLNPVRLGVDAAWTPLEYIDTDGGYQGFSSDYMDRFTRQLGLDIALAVKVQWPEVLKKVKALEFDVVPMIVATPERRQYLNFTKPYIDFPLVVYSRRDSNIITDFEDVADKRLAVVKGYMAVEYLKADYPDIETVEVATALDALHAVLFGKVDAYIGCLLVGSYLIEHEGLVNLKIAAPTPYRLPLSIGVRKDWPILVSLFDRAIDSVTETDKAAIRRNWLKIRYEQEVDYSLVWIILGGSFVIISLMLYRNVEINRQKKLLWASESQIKLLINALPIAIVIVDRSGMIIFDNAQAGREIGNDKSLVGRNSEEFYADPADRVHVLKILAKKGQVASQHVKYRIDSGKIIDCLLSVLPIRFDGRDVLLGVTVNVTERIKMEQQMALAKKHAEEADHLKSAFLASMSHELRTPLNSIIGFTGILLQELAGSVNAEQRKQLSMVQSSSRHLLSLINDVLDISKIEAGELKIFCKSFDIRDSIEKVIQTVHPLADQQGLNLYYDIDPAVNQMNSDQRRVEQILFNLIGNALKFTESGKIVVRCQIDTHLLVIAVKDTGPGIKPEDMNKLFQTFQQIDTGVTRVHEGSGLGLSISKKLAEKLGGDIQVESEMGEGSVFTVRLPMNLPEMRNQKILENGTFV